MTYNSTTYNGGVYNTVLQSNAQTVTDDIIFNDYGLQNASIVVSDINYGTAPKRLVASTQVPRGHGHIINNIQWAPKIIKLKGHLTNRDATGLCQGGCELDTLIDTMKRNLNVESGVLKINDQCGEARVYEGMWINTHKSLAKREHFHISHHPFELEFFVPTGYGYDQDYSSEFIEGITNSTINQTVENTGSANAFLDLYLQFTSADTVSSILVTNVTTGECIQITDTLSTGVVYTLKGSDLTVTKGSSSQDYDGAHLTIQPGVNNIQIDVTSTSHEFEATYKWKNAYL